MRLLSLCILVQAVSSLSASECAYPLWDGQESVADYAKRVSLPPTQTLDLGNGVKMELVLIPPGKFIMGTPEPLPVDEDAFHKKIGSGQVLLALSAGALLVMLMVVLVRVICQRQRPRVSLGQLLAMTVAAGIALLSGMHWSESARGLDRAKLEYKVAKARFDSANPEETPAHPVTLTRPFYMGKYTVTQEQYQAVTGANRSRFKGNNHPVEMVSWDDAQDFCTILTEQSKQAIRLPTEGEWEYACRAGTTTIYHSGDADADLKSVAWYDGNSQGTTHPVGQKEANAFGLYDMHGNVWQWCQDWYEEDYYKRLESEDPQGPAKGSWRLLRGGSWDFPAWCCRSANRRKFDPVRRFGDHGFRVVAPASTTP
ncbi:MAG TPA: formylglycine-generating enzyme family protein [Planctomycetota bacterium]|nr:formylglycine-generating enzyme family protein [Planctomycetota bacterium]